MNKFEKVIIGQFIHDTLFDIIQSGEFEDDEFVELVDNATNIYNNIKLPKRATSKSSGYDIYSPTSFTLEAGQTIKVPTGIKVQLDDDKFLAVIVRSSMGFKYNVRLLNQFGNIDSDYYSNPGNDGHIWVGLKNEGNRIWKVEAGDAIAQGIILNYNLTIDDSSRDERSGGIGSTDEAK